ncbi:DNA-processing protein DprA [Phytobacter sp. V91]|uniref:DNA-processing protein DprA n=1 Tax=Phytobacter sp. V91 TaxID=3369425 RepID=UPI003F5D65AF
MNLSPMAQATLLLTSYFSQASRDDVKPLSNTEWGRFARWLKEQSVTPADLLTTDVPSLLQTWQDPHISTERVIALLNRGHSLALATEKWQRAGLWLVTRADPEYPWRLKQRLKTGAPPVLFGCGNKNLLNMSGLAVVGSRNASDPDLQFTSLVGAKAASEKLAIVSGGARGVDEAAMLGAMQGNGAVIGIMADSLLTAATSAKWRHGLMNGNLVLISPFYPEAGFSVGNAMARNKYIYCLAESALVIHSGTKGGTLNGAEENLKNGWVPLWVKPTDDSNAANAHLVAKGARWSVADIQHLTLSSLLHAEGSSPEQSDLFAADAHPTLYSSAETEAPSRSVTLREEKPDYATQNATAGPVDFYQIFIRELAGYAENPVTLEALTALTQLNKHQLSDWLKRATDSGLVEQLTHPVRYQWRGHQG